MSMDELIAAKAAKLAEEHGVPIVGGSKPKANKVIAVCGACGNTIDTERAKDGPCRMMECPIRRDGTVEGVTIGK